MTNTIIKPVEKETPAKVEPAKVAPATVPDKAVDEVVQPAPVKRGRGRPAGSTNKPAFEEVAEDSAKPATPRRTRKPSARNAKKNNPAELAKQITGLHLMASMMTGVPEVQISDEEGQQLAIAVVNVAELYNLSIDGKTGAAIQLMAACAMIYAPRALMIRHRLKEERAAAQASHVPEDAQQQFFEPNVRGE